MCILNTLPYRPERYVSFIRTMSDHRPFPYCWHLVTWNTRVFVTARKKGDVTNWIIICSCADKNKTWGGCGEWSSLIDSFDFSGWRGYGCHLSITIPDHYPRHPPVPRMLSIVNIHDCVCVSTIIFVIKEHDKCWTIFFCNCGWKLKKNIDKDTN